MPHNNLLLEFTLNEIAPGDDLVKRVAYDVAALFEELQNEELFLSESELSNAQLEKIFKNASLVSQGKSLSKMASAGRAAKSGILGTASGLSKLNKGFDNLIKKYENAGGKVTAFNDKADKAFEKIGNKVRSVKGGDKALQVMKKLGQWGKENPGKQAIVLGVLSAAAGFMGGAAIPAVAVPIYKAVTAGAAGDKLTTIIGKAVKGAALGGVAGAIGDSVASLFGDAAEDIPEQKISSTGNTTYMINGQEVSKEEYDSHWKPWEDMLDREEARMEATMSGVRDIAEKMGIEGKFEAKVIGGVPVEINGQEVTKDLLSDEQLAKIESVKKFEKEVERLEKEAESGKQYTPNEPTTKVTGADGVTQDY